MSLYQYGNDFYAYQQIGALASARAVVPLVSRHLRPNSILDVGCGAGAWLAAWLEHGVADVAGVDGNYVRSDQLRVDVSRFTPIDVARPFWLERRFDLVQCLEVAEHLDPAASEMLVANLVSHAPSVLFSAAPPGQGGEHHVNERPFEFWRGLFARHGYACFDFFRPRLGPASGVEPWYRYNLLLFVREDATATLDPEVAATRLAARAKVPDVSPLAYRARKLLLRTLPVAAVSWLASLKHRKVLVAHSQARTS